MTRASLVRALALAGAVFALGTGGSAAALILNPGFETGDFTSWSPTGHAIVVTAAVGSGPTEGTFQAQMTNLSSQGAVSAALLEAALGEAGGFLTGLSPSGNAAVEGSIVQQTFVAAAGDTLTFDWNFLSNEAVGEATYMDFAFWHLSGAESDSGVLADTNDLGAGSATSYTNETGFGVFSRVLSGGSYTLSVGLTDVEDNLVSSSVLADNFELTAVPEPTPAVLVAVGLAGIGWVGRRRPPRTAG